MGFCQVSKLLWAPSPVQTMLPMISNWRIHWASQVCPQSRARASQVCPQYRARAHRRGQDQAQLRASLCGTQPSHTGDGGRRKPREYISNLLYSTRSSTCFINMNNNFLCSFLPILQALFHLIILKSNIIPIIPMHPS